MVRSLSCVFLAFSVLAASSECAFSQDDLEQRIDQLAKKVDRLESKIDSEAAAAVGFLFGAFCALWAQNTGRNPWLWFFLGVFFNVITVLVLLAKNSTDRRVARGEPPSSGASVALAIVLGILLLALAAVVFWMFVR